MFSSGAGAMAVASPGLHEMLTMSWRDDAEREILELTPGSSGLVDAAAELARLLELARGQLALTDSCRYGLPKDLVLVE